jgi:hypothetical protein
MRADDPPAAAIRIRTPLPRRFQPVIATRAVPVHGFSGPPFTPRRRARPVNERHRFARARLAGVLCLAVMASACDRLLPTTAEIERMDVATLQARAAQASGGAPGATYYFVDDRPVTEAEGRAMTGERVVRLEMSRAPSGGSMVRIYTSPDAQADAGEGSVRFRPGEDPPLHARSDAATAEVRMTTPDRFAGLLVIDGAISDRAALGRLRPDDIDKVVVMRGVAAVRIWNDPRAANGAVAITTVRGSR